jgi:hypothetical protein
LASIFGFKVKFLNFVSINHNNAGFFRVGGIDKHFLRHIIRLHNARTAAPGGAAVLGMCLVRAIMDARQNQAKSPSAVMQNAIARVIAFFSDTRQQ